MEFSREAATAEGEISEDGRPIMILTSVFIERSRERERENGEGRRR